MEISVDDAVAAIRAEAEAHEHENGGEFCEHTRAALTAHVMVNLDLSLASIGLVAEAFMDAILEDAPDDEQQEQWPTDIGE